MFIGAMVLLGVRLWAADADQAVVRLLRMSRDVERVRVVQRAQVDAELDLVLVFGSPKDTALATEGNVWWSPKTKAGVFLQKRSEPGMVYTLAIERGGDFGDCEVRVERVTASDLVLSCRPEKGTRGENRKYVFDARAKGLVKRVDYERIPMERVAVHEGRALLRGSSMAMEYDPADGTFRVRQGLAPAVAKPKPVLPKAPLPQSTYDEFAAARPRRVKDGYARAHSKMNESIGPSQSVDGVLWFGKSFYDSEGMTGVGGFGYFDATERKYRIYSPPEVRDWSVTAMLAEKDAVWLALASHSEWRSFGGGVLRFDRTTEEVKVYRMDDLVGDMAQVGGRLVLATEFGGAVLEGEKVRHFFLDKTTDGRWRVIERQ